MIQKNIIKLLTGANKIARESKNLIRESSIDFIEKSVIKGNYVSREEHEQLKNLVFTIQERLDALTKKE